MNGDCTDIQRLIWSDGVSSADPSHLEACTSCREESRRAGDLQAALVGLRNREAIVPLELEAQILEAVSRTRMDSTVDRARNVVQHPRFWKGAAVGAAAAATAVAGLIVARRLSSRPEDEPSLVA